VYAKLQSAVESAEDEKTAAVESVTKSLKETAAKEKSSALHVQKMTMTTEFAGLEARNEQLLSLIADKDETIRRLGMEVDKQRELTQRVAESSRAAPVQQTFGKS